MYITLGLTAASGGSSKRAFQESTPSLLSSGFWRFLKTQPYKTVQMYNLYGWVFRRIINLMMETESVFETLVCLNILTRVSIEEDLSVFMCYEKPGDLFPASATSSRPRPLLCAILTYSMVQSPS